MFGNNQGKGLLGMNMSPQAARAMQGAGLALSQLSAGRPANLAPLHKQMYDEQQGAKMQEALGPALERMPPEMRSLVASMPPALGAKYVADFMMQKPAADPNAALKDRLRGAGYVPGTPEWQQGMLHNGAPPTAKPVERAIMVDPSDTATLDKLGISPESVKGMPPFEVKVSEGPNGITVKDISIPGGRTNQVGAVPLGTEGQILVTDPSTESGYRVDVAPGSKLDTAQADVSVNKTEQIAKADESITLIDSVLNDEGLPSVLGRVQGRLDPTGMSGLVMSEKQLDLVPKLEQIQGKAFMDAFQSLKGGGQITEREGQAALNAAARLQRYQSPEAYKKSLTELRQTLERAKLRANGFKVPEFGDPSEYGDSGGGSAPSGVPQDLWDHMTPEEKAVF